MPIHVRREGTNAYATRHAAGRLRGGGPAPAPQQSAEAVA